MKRIVLFCAVVCAAMAISSCGSSKESAYRKAYEKAKAQEASQSLNEATNEVEQTVAEKAPVVTPLVEAPAQSAVVSSGNNVGAREESVSVVSGSGLKGYSVVVGSFGVRANAESLQQRLTNAGYPAQVAYNASNKMYRVVATTFDNQNSAVESRSTLRSQYPDAWLLINK